MFASVVIAAAGIFVVTVVPMPWAGSMPVGDLPGWKQTVAQDFNEPTALGEVGKVHGSTLRGYDGVKDTSRNGTYDPDSVLSLSGGMLDFYLHSERGQPRVAAPVVGEYRGQTYGRYSVRFRSDKLPGYKIAFLLWPVSNEWNEGEIDWPEGDLNGRMSPASAVVGSYTNGIMRFEPSTRVFSPTDSSDWHVATTEWTPESVKWFWDGQLVGETSSQSAVPQTPFRWTLQAETATDGLVPDVDTAGHLQVDWVVQYSYVAP